MVSKFVVEGDVEGVEGWAEEEFEVEAGKDGNGQDFRIVRNYGMNFIYIMSLQKENERKQCIDALLANIPIVLNKFIVIA